MNYSGVIYADHSDNMRIELQADITYAKRDGKELKLHFIAPPGSRGKRPGGGPEKPDPIMEQRIRVMMGKYPVKHQNVPPTPLLVYIPGSGWHGGDGKRVITQFIPVVKSGIAVATVDYRGTERDHVRYPAAVQDAKEAVRFLIANAERFNIDPNRIAIAGDSSGGHTAAAAVITDGDPEYDVGDNLDTGFKVGAVGLFSAPIDIENLVQDRLACGYPLRPGENPYPAEAFELYENNYLDDPDFYLHKASLSHYVTPGKNLPPFIIFNGSDDPFVTESHAMRFADTLVHNGVRVELYKMVNAKHGGGCWPLAAMDTFILFMKAYFG